jgi:hypothetical protein
MLKNRHQLISFILIYIFISCQEAENDFILCDCIHNSTPKDTYIYPVRPGTSKWNELENGYQRINVCQVPDSILLEISTEGLIETCLTHPLLFELIYTDLPGGGLQWAMEKMIKNYNCFSELSKRQNAGIYLLKRYQLINPCCVKKTNKPGEFANSFSEFEMILSQKCFMEQLSDNELLELISKAFSNYNEKLEYEDYFSWVYGMNTSVLLIGRGMLFLEYKPFLKDYKEIFYIERFVNTSALPEGKENFIDLFDEIVKHAEILIKLKTEKL